MNQVRRAITGSRRAGPGRRVAAVQAGPSPGSLIGRDDDLGYITAFVDQAAESGGALLLSGAAGVGKTVLLDAAVAHAEATGSRVLRAADAEFEMAVSFAGLNQLLGPLLGQAQGLSVAYRQALDVALGVREGHVTAADGSPRFRGAARDVDVTVVRIRPAVSLTPGAGS